MGKTILLAEDSPDDELFFKRVLTSAGVMNTVKVVRDSRQVLDYLKGEGFFADREDFPLPDVLFLDLLMPPADGWAVLEWLQTQPPFTKMLVIVLSQIGDLRRMRDAYAMGASSFLIKPFNRDDLESLMRHWPSYWTLEPRGMPPPPERASGESATENA